MNANINTGIINSLTPVRPKPGGGLGDTSVSGSFPAYRYYAFTSPRVPIMRSRAHSSDSVDSNLSEDAPQWVSRGRSGILMTGWRLGVRVPSAGCAVFAVQEG